jgi:GTP cyclohydrolase I
MSGRSGVVDYPCRFFGRADADSFRFEIDVRVPVATLCPCSKAISDYGAHNQRAEVHVVVEPEPDAFVWLEDLIAVIEAQASCPIFSVLKRSDEKWVTERAYENPKFVEDVVRDTVLALREMAGVGKYSVRCESLESIHNHCAVASIGWTRTPIVLEGDLDPQVSWSATTG